MYYFHKEKYFQYVKDKLNITFELKIPELYFFLKKIMFFIINCCKVFFQNNLLLNNKIHLLLYHNNELNVLDKVNLHIFLFYLFKNLIIF